jgi:hypothetical protein
VKQIDGVPESITRERYASLIAAVGFNVTDLRRLEFRLDGVYADVYDRDDKGHLRIDEQRNEAIVNRVYIPVMDSPTP